MELNEPFEFPLPNSVNGSLSLKKSFNTTRIQSKRKILRGTKPSFNKTEGKENTCLVNMGRIIYSPKYRSTRTQSLGKVSLPKRTEGKMKKYYKRKNELNKKYKEMIEKLNKEEQEEISWVMLRYNREYVAEKVKEVNESYALTKNLILQQQLIEEEELLKEIKYSN